MAEPTGYRERRAARTAARRKRIEQRDAGVEARGAGEPVALQRGGFGIQPGGVRPVARPTFGRAQEAQESPQGDVPGAIGTLSRKLGPKVISKGIDALSAPAAPSFDRGASEGAFQAQRTGERDLTPFQIPGRPELSLPPQIFGAPRATIPTNVLGLTPDIAGDVIPSVSGAGAGVAPGATTAHFAAPTGGFDIGSLGGAGTVGTGISAILGALAQATGNPELAKAAQAAGIATGGIGLAGTASSLASLAPLLGTATAAVPTGAAAGLGGGAATGLAAGGTAGIGTAAGAAAAPIAAALIIDSINQLAGGEPTYDFGAMLAPLMGEYWKFAPELGQTLGAERSGIDALTQALPYVQSQEDLSSLLGSFRERIGQRVGGFGEGVDPFTIPNLPGAGGSKHEGGQVADFGGTVNDLNALIQKLKPALPAGGAVTPDLYSTFETNIANAARRGVSVDEAMYAGLSPELQAETDVLFPKVTPIPFQQSAAWQGLLQPSAEPATAAAPAVAIGASPEAVSGAGKLQPQFATPELDLRAEAVQGAGRAQGPQARPGAEGRPFGMGQRPTGGMQVGGGPRGNAPFGGVSRQSMMPQQGGGVQARRSGGSRGAV